MTVACVIFSHNQTVAISYAKMSKNEPRRRLRMSLAFIFPGQGSQAPGMGKAVADAFPAARVVLDEVNDALDQDLATLMFEGPADELTLTANAQPALMAAGLSVMAALNAEFDLDVTRASHVAGHSLGEYSALAAAGSLSIADTARLLRTRGQAMQSAVPVGEGAMAALLGAELDHAEDACRIGQEHGVCQIANDNAPGQVVISGVKAAVEAAMARAKDLGVKKAILLPVSAPFHCSLMQPAADAMSEALSLVALHVPSVPVVANVTARPETDPARIRPLLIEQVTGTVRWRECAAWMAKDGGVTRMAEVGVGKVLTAMHKRALPDVTGAALNTPDDVEAFAKSVLEGA